MTTSNNKATRLYNEAATPDNAGDVTKVPTTPTVPGNAVLVTTTNISPNNSGHVVNNLVPIMPVGKPFTEGVTGGLGEPIDGTFTITGSSRHSGYFLEIISDVPEEATEQDSKQIIYKLPYMKNYTTDKNLSFSPTPVGGMSGKNYVHKDSITLNTFLSGVQGGTRKIKFVLDPNAVGETTLVLPEGQTDTTYGKGAVFGLMFVGNTTAQRWYLFGDLGFADV